MTVVRVLLCVVALSAAPTLSAAELKPVNADGFRTALDAERGNVVLVNFWATWCRPCLEEIPLLMELQTELDAAGFSLVAVSLDDAAAADELVKPFIEKWFPGFVSLQNLEYDMDKLVSVIDPAWNQILPTSYVLKADGSVNELIQGARTKAEFRASILAAFPEPD